MTTSVPRSHSTALQIRFQQYNSCKMNSSWSLFVHFRPLDSTILTCRFPHVKAQITQTSAFPTLGCGKLSSLCHRQAPPLHGVLYCLVRVWAATCGASSHLVGELKAKVGCSSPNSLGRLLRPLLLLLQQPDQIGQHSQVDHQ